MLTLALISDLHFGLETRHAGKLRKLTREAPGLAKAFVDRMNEHVRPDLVVNLGDDIEDEDREADLARYRGCIQVLSRAHADRIHVAGNHDTIHLTHDDVRAAWGAGPWDASAGRRDLCYSFDRGGFHFTVLETHERQDVDITVGPEQLAWLAADLRAAWGPGPWDEPTQRRDLRYSFERGGFHFTVLETHERPNVDITLGEEQLAWLAEDLRKARLPVVVLMHHSASEQDLRGNYWFEGREHVALVKERAAFRDILLASRKVRIVLNGHVHWNHLDIVDGLPFVTVQSLIENLDEDAPGRPAAAHAVVRLDPHRTTIDLFGAERARYQLDVTPSASRP